jgi:diguanylate cyclase (GGDEF)-like protein
MNAMAHLLLPIRSRPPPDRVALRRWFDRNLRMAELPPQARLFAIGVLAIGTIVVMIDLFLIGLPPVGPLLVFMLVLSFVAIVIEERSVTLLGYGMQSEAFAPIISITGMVLLGPCYALYHFVIQTFWRRKERSQIPLYRIFFNFSLFIATTTAIAFAVALDPSGRASASLPFLVTLAVGLNMNSIFSMVMLLPQIAFAGGPRRGRRQLVREWAEFAMMDLVSATAVLLLVRSYHDFGQLGIVFIGATLALPLMVGMARVSDEAYGRVTVVARQTAQHGEERTVLSEQVRAASTDIGRDELTGLAGKVRFEADIKALGSSGRRATVVMADIAGLKVVNDNRGHDAGNALLVIAARALSGAVRSTDTAYRLGGDEFALIAGPMTPATIARMKGRIDDEVTRGLRAEPLLTGVVSWLRLGWAITGDDPGSVASRADAHLIEVHAADVTAGRVGRA